MAKAKQTKGTQAKRTPAKGRQAGRAPTKRVKTAKKRALVPDDLYRLREAAHPSLAPDGTVAFVVTSADRDNDENRSSIWSVRPGDEPMQLTRGPNDSSPKWSPDGSMLGFLRRTDGPPQVCLLPAHGGEARTLTNLPLGATGFVWSPDGTRLAVTGIVDLDGIPEDEQEKQRRATAPRVITNAAYKADGTGLIGSKRVHLFVVDAETGEATDLLDGDVNAQSPAWSPDGKRIAYGASLADRAETLRTHLFVIRATGGEPEEVVEWGGSAGAPFWSSDGKTLAFAGNPEPGPGHTRLFAAVDGAAVSLAPDFDRNVMIGGPAYPGAPPRFLPDGTILFCARDRGCTNAFTVRDGVVTKVLGDDSSVVSAVSSSGDRAAYVLSSPEIPADVFVANVDGSDVARLTDLNRELLGEVKLHRCEPRTFTAADGLEVHGWVMVGTPPTGSTGPRPLLLDIHGGPHNAWSPTFDAVHLYHEMLASLGWSIVRLNPRGSDGYGEKFMTGVVGGWGISDEQDFVAALDALVAEGIADPDRLAVCGYSYGGYMTNWLTSHTQSTGHAFKAAMSGGTVSDLFSEYGTSDFGPWMGRFEHGGDLHEARSRFAASNPMSFVEHVTTPTLILHGENDDRCPVGQAEQWFASLQRMGVVSEFVRYPGGSHLFILLGRPSHRVDYNQRIYDWMVEHNTEG